MNASYIARIASSKSLSSTATMMFISLEPWSIIRILIFLDPKAVNSLAETRPICHFDSDCGYKAYVSINLYIFGFALFF